MVDERLLKPEEINKLWEEYEKNDPYQETPWEDSQLSLSKLPATRKGRVNESKSR